jgi:ABC-type lipoprotein release transport system permease subunit
LIRKCLEIANEPYTKTTSIKYNVFIFLIDTFVFRYSQRPLAWYFLRNWLNDFACRIDLSAMPFLIALAITLFIALLTTLYQTLRAALQNPADSLRYE